MGTSFLFRDAAARNRTALQRDRLIAIRSMSEHGTLLGADALIDVVRDPSEPDLLRRSAALELEFILGHAGGLDAERWDAWLQAAKNRLSE